MTTNWMRLIEFVMAASYAVASEAVNPLQLLVGITLSSSFQFQLSYVTHDAFH